jgi:SAM-dependent methyltransferase
MEQGEIMTQPGTGRTEDQKPTTQRINEMAFAFKNTGTLIGALELGLFTRVAESDGPADPAEVAEKIGMSLDAAQRLMIACAALGLLEDRGGGYVNAPDVDRYLVRERPTYFGDYLVYQAKSDYDGWKNIASRLRPPKRAYHAMAADPQAARAFTVAGYNSSISLAHKLAKAFDFSRYSMFLDLGGGSGCYSIAACLRHPGLRAIVFDQLNVVVVAQEFIEQASLSDRVTTVAGDFFDSEFPRGADLVSFITPLQAYGPEDVQFLIKKAFDAVEPGGGILILDYMMNEDRSGPLDSVFRHLGGIMSPTNPGYVNTGAEFSGYLTRAGFVEVEANDTFLPGSVGMVSGRKPR